MLSCLCCQGTDTRHMCMCLCRHPACVWACLYVGTTCYSQGWSSLRPVSLCVYSSGGLLPPDYKKDWWINNIQLSLALSLSHSLRPWSLCVFTFYCVCMCLYLYMGVCVHTVYAFLFVNTLSWCVCLCLQHLSVDQALLHLADSWPLLAGSRQSGNALTEPGTNSQRKEKASSLS